MVLGQLISRACQPLLQSITIQMPIQLTAFPPRDLISPSSPPPRLIVLSAPPADIPSLSNLKSSTICHRPRRPAAPPRREPGPISRWDRYERAQHPRKVHGCRGLAAVLAAAAEISTCLLAAASAMADSLLPRHDHFFVSTILDILLIAYTYQYIANSSE